MLCTYKLWKDRDSDPENPLKFNRMRSHPNIPVVLDALIQEVANAEKDLEYVTGTRNQISTFFRSRLNIGTSRCREFKCTWQILYAF
jgi:hypothetical protein